MSVRAINWALGVFRLIDIPPKERLVLLIICNSHNHKTGECFPSYDMIALLSGYDRRSVIRSVKLLKSWGMIDVKKRSVGGQQRSNHIVLFGSLKRNSGVTHTTPLRGGARVTPSGVVPVSPDREVYIEGKKTEANVVFFSTPKAAR